MQQIRSTLHSHFFVLQHQEKCGEIKACVLSKLPKDLEYLLDNIVSQEMAQARYHQWAWNIGRSPRFTVSRSGRLPLGTADLTLEVYKGHIVMIDLVGEFLGGQELQSFYDALVGVRYDREVLLNRLNEIDLAYYFGLVESEDLVNLIY